jgi:phage terminase small subunit
VPTLPNQKHERFAQAMSLEGAEQRKAYLDAGFQATIKGADANASKLMRRPDVKARIQELRTTRVEGLVSQVQELVGPLDKEVFSRIGRAKMLAKTARELEQVIAERAVEYKDLPGGKTGHVVVKGVKKQDGKEVIVSAVDTKLLQERRSTFEQIARELGQWVEKRDDTLEVRHIADLSDEMIEEILREAEEIKAREEKLKGIAPPIELTRVDPGDEEPTGARDPVVTYQQQ